MDGLYAVCLVRHANSYDNETTDKRYLYKVLVISVP